MFANIIAYNQVFVSCRSTQEECLTNIATDSEVQHIVRFIRGVKDRRGRRKRRQERSKR